MAIREITAKVSKKSVSVIRSEIGDLEYQIYRTDDELLYKLNDAIEDICNDTLCLTETFKFDLIPGKYEYSGIDLVSTAFNILQVQKVSIFTPANEEDTSKKPDPVSKELFNKIRTGNSDKAADYPRYYCFDRSSFSIWKPYGTAGYKIELEIAREFMEEDHADYDKDPPGVIIAKYIKQARMGAVYKCIASKPELQEILDPKYYYNEFMKYKTKGQVSPHFENEKTEFNELNLE